MARKVFGRILILVVSAGALASLTLYLGDRIDRVAREARLELERLDLERAELENEMIRRDAQLAAEIALAATRDCQILQEVDRRIQIAKATLEQEHREIYRKMAKALQSSAIAEQQARQALERSQQAQRIATAALYQSQTCHQPLYYSPGYGCNPTSGCTNLSPADAARYQEWLAMNHLMNVWAANLFPSWDDDRVAQVRRTNLARARRGSPLRSETFMSY